MRGLGVGWSCYDFRRNTSGGGSMWLVHWAGVIGLVLDITGTIFLTYGLIISEREAAKLGASYFSSDNWRENLKIPPVADRLRTSRNAQIGVLFLVLGFVGQLIAAWPKS